MMGCIALLVFLLFHHPLQQWAEAEEQDGGYYRHDDEDEEEVVEVGDGDAHQVFGLSGFGIECGEFACAEIADGGGQIPNAHHQRGKAFG